LNSCNRIMSSCDGTTLYRWVYVLRRQNFVVRTRHLLQFERLRVTLSRAVVLKASEFCPMSSPSLN
jgi:hypothetical protein